MPGPAGSYRMTKLVTVVIECKDDKDQVAVGAPFIGFSHSEKGEQLEGRCVGAYVGDAIGKLARYEEALASVKNDTGRGHPTIW